MGSMHAEIELLRDKELTGFYHLYARLIRTNSELAQNKAAMILYAACELTAIDYSTQDISLIYLLENKIFEDPKYNGYFLTDFGQSLREGAAILKDAIAVAQYLKQNAIDIPLGADNKPDVDALSSLLANSRGDILKLQFDLDRQASKQQTNEQQLAETSLMNYTECPEWQSELLFQLREYRIYLESKLETEPENQTSIDLINRILNTKSEHCAEDIKKFMILQKPTDNLGQTIKQKILKLIIFIFNNQLYKQFDALMTQRAAWSQPKEAPSQQQSSDENTEDKENQASLGK